MLSPTRLLEPLREFLREEAAGGILLMIAAAVALVIANSPAVGGVGRPVAHPRRRRRG